MDPRQRDRRQADGPRARVPHPRQPIPDHGDQRAHVVNATLEGHVRAHKAHRRLDHVPVELRRFHRHVRRALSRPRTRGPRDDGSSRGGPMTELSRRDLLRAGAAGALGLWLPFATDARSATWHARTANSRVPRRALAELRRALRGTLLLPGDPGYDVASAPANFRYDSIRPLAVASCRNEADVIT